MPHYVDPFTDDELRKERRKQETKLAKYYDPLLPGHFVRYNLETGNMAFYIQADQPRVDAQGKKVGAQSICIRIGKALQPTGDPNRLTATASREEAREIRTKIRSGEGFTENGKSYPGLDAQKVAAELESKVAKSKTLRWGMERFFYRKVLKSEARMRAAMKRRFSDALDRPLSYLTAEYADSLFDIRQRTIVADFRVLRQITNWLHRDKMSPKIDLDFREQVQFLLSDFKDQPEMLTIMEWHLPHMWAAFNEQKPLYRDLFKFWLLTGMRREEAARLEWANVHFNNSSYSVPETKTGQPLFLHMTDYVREMLLRRHEERGDNYAEQKYVFGSPGWADGFLSTEHGHGSKDFALVRERVKELSHDEMVRVNARQLRKFFGDRAELLEVNSDVIRAIQNHAPAGVAARHYRNRLTTENKRIPMQRIEDYMLQHSRQETGDVRTFPVSASKLA